MRLPQSGLRIDSPAWPLLQATITYWGITTGAGAATGLTLVDANCGGGIEPSFTGLSVKILDGGAAGQVRPIQVHTLGTGTLAFLNPFTSPAGVAQQIAAGTRFCILSSSAGGGGPAPVLAPSIGLWMFGECDPGMAASTTAIPLTNLIGFPDDIFNNEFWMQVIHNTDAPGTAPEREIRQITDYVGLTGVFTTDAFSANVEAGDLVAVFHESIMGIEILGFGTLDISSVTVPADSTRAAAYAWENDDYFKGCTLMPTSGDCRFQPRPIRTYTNATGVFTLDEPFSQLPGTVDYVIIAGTYPVQRLIDIFNIVNAELILVETGGTLTTDGTEQTVYQQAAPAGVFKPKTFLLNCTNLALANTIVVRTFYQINPAGALVPSEAMTFVGPLDPEHRLIEIPLLPNRYGFEITLEHTVGAPGDTYEWEVFYEV